MESGILYIVSTPIGNLEDITLRAIRILKEVDLIAAEDTRTARKLLNHLNISKPVTSFFEHNEDDKKNYILKNLKSGNNIALISEAGTPSISDPGYKLIKAALDEDLKVIPIPGVAAAITAISASGLPTNRFMFVGFLPDKPTKRKKVLEDLKLLDCTLIFYVSKYKILQVLKDMLDIFGDRRAVLCRELTKMYEEIKAAAISMLLEQLSAGKVKGEITLVVGGRDAV